MIKWIEVRPGLFKSLTFLPISVYKKLLHKYPDNIYMSIDMLGIEDRRLIALDFEEAKIESIEKAISTLSKYLEELRGVEL